MEQSLQVKHPKLIKGITELLLSRSLLKYRFFGFFCTQLIFVEDYSIGTAGVTIKRDGAYFYYNPDFLDELDGGNIDELKEVIYLIYHEIMHLQSKHILRNYGFHKKEQLVKTNIVQDAIMNYNIQLEYSKDVFLHEKCELLKQKSKLDVVKSSLKENRRKQKSKNITEINLLKLQQEEEFMLELIPVLESNPDTDINNIKDERNLFKDYLFIDNWYEASTGVHLEPFIKAGFDKGEQNENMFFEKLYVWYDEYLAKLQTKADAIGYKNLVEEVKNNNKTYKIKIDSHTPKTETVFYTSDLDLISLQFIKDKDGKTKIISFQGFDDTYYDEELISPEEMNSVINKLNHECHVRGLQNGMLDELLKRITPQKENFLKNIFVNVNKLKGSATLLKTYRKLNKKHDGDEFIKKGRYYDTKSLNILCDYSGSMHGMVEPILGYCLKDNYIGNLVFCDTVVTKENIVKLKKPSDIQRIKGFVDAYGGTELMPGVNYIKSEYGTDNILILTDGYCDEIDLSGYKKALIISCGIPVKVTRESRYFKQIVVDPKEVLNV